MSIVAVFYFAVITKEASCCPVCHEELGMIGTRERVRWKANYVQHKLLIRRLYCENCHKIHHEIPDCLVPYKRYEADVIEGAIEGKPANELGVSDNAVYRFRCWWGAVETYFSDILEMLAAKYDVSFGSPPTFREAVRAATNSNNWTFAHRLSTCSGVCTK